MNTNKHQFNSPRPQAGPKRSAGPGRLTVTLLSLFTLCASVVPVLAQSRQIPSPPQSHPVALINTTIHPVSAPTINTGYIIFDKGVITAIGSGPPPENLPADVIRHDARGLQVFPGLIAASSYIGLSEIGDIDQTNDNTELGRVKPEVIAAVAINPDSDLIPVARSNGILTAMIMPRGGLVAGRCSAIRLDGWTWEDMTIDPAAGLVVNWPRTEPVTAWWMERSEEDQRKEIKEDLEAVEKVFDDAAAYIKARDADATLSVDLRYEAMRPMLRDEKPIFISAALAGQIESAVAWAVRRNFKIVIVGGDQADRVAPLLKKHDVPVIVSGIHRLPTRRQDAYDQPFTLPAKLHEAGVRFCIASGGAPADERHLNHMAATAAAFGLPKDEALKSVTINAAQILGLGDRLGSIEKGKSATLIVTNGDPLELTTETLVAYIDGRQVDLSDRQKSLYEKYQQKYRQLGILK